MISCSAASKGCRPGRCAGTPPGSSPAPGGSAGASCPRCPARSATVSPRSVVSSNSGAAPAALASNGVGQHCRDDRRVAVTSADSARYMGRADVVSKDHVELSRAQVFGAVRHGRNSGVSAVLGDEVDLQMVGGSGLSQKLVRKAPVAAKASGARSWRVQSNSGVYYRWWTTTARSLPVAAASSTMCVRPGRPWTGASPWAGTVTNCLRGAQSPDGDHHRRHGGG